jgi:hypothetical protein
VYRPGCHTVGSVDVTCVDRHPEAGPANSVLGALFPVRAGAPMARLRGTHALPPAAVFGDPAKERERPVGD